MENPRIILLETSTDSCSAAICEGERILAEKYTETPKMQSALLAPFVDELLHDCGIKASDCDAVAVSEGPGSYTGLRVGVSTAKGICFGARRPLIAINTLQILAWQGLGKADFIVPMIDARRMEVYCAVFDGKTGKPVTETEAMVLDETSFADLLSKGSVLFIGNGSAKFAGIISNANAIFETCCPKASSMAHAAVEAYKKEEFKDVAYFEPFYLKEFVAGISTKSVL